MLPTSSSAVRDRGGCPPAGAHPLAAGEPAAGLLCPFCPARASGGCKGTWGGRLPEKSTASRHSSVESSLLSIPKWLLYYKLKCDPYCSHSSILSRCPLQAATTSSAVRREGISLGERRLCKESGVVCHHMHVQMAGCAPQVSRDVSPVMWTGCIPRVLLVHRLF